MNGLLQDVRYALRQMRKSPGFTASAVVALALGIGGTTVIFSVVYAALLQPLPYVESQRLVTMHVDDARNRGLRGRNEFLTTDFLDIQRENHVFDEVIGVHPRDAVLTGTAIPERFDCDLVTANTFSVLGVPPLYGRTPTVEDVKPDSPRVVVLSYKVFERNFGKDPSVVGRTILLDEQAATVIGIMAPRFAGSCALSVQANRHTTLCEPADEVLPAHHNGDTAGSLEKKLLGRHQPGRLMATAESRYHHHYYCASLREQGFDLRD